MSLKRIVAVVTIAACGGAFADTYTVNEGETQTQTSITNTTRFTKAGAGTLVLSGNNSLASMTVSAGTLNVHGGTTTISGSGSDGAYGNSAFVNNGNKFIVDGGATVKITGGAYGHTDNGILHLQNGTFDATALGNDFMNGFTGSFPSSRIVIDDGGVLKAGTLRVVGGEGGTEDKKENFSIDLNAGGSLYVNKFWEDAKDRYGRINFNGGVLYPTMEGKSGKGDTYLFFNGDSIATWTKSMVTPTILAGGCYMSPTKTNFIFPAFKSGVGEGEKDGGLHMGGNATIYWRAKNSTYNGGTWLEGNGIFALNGGDGDSCLGAVPETPTTNIYIMSSGHTLFSESGTMNIHSNRMVFVKNGKTFYTGSQGRLVIGGEIRTEPSPGLDYSTNNYFCVREDWAGTVVIGPGEGITNSLGRAYVGAGLEVKSGVFQVAAYGQKMGDHSLVESLYVKGNGSSYSNTKGYLRMTGGELCSPRSNYAEVSKYGHVEVVGGKINMPTTEWLIGLAGPARLSVSNNGEFVSGATRIGQHSGAPTEFNLGKGGLFRPKQLYIELKNNQNVTFNFDGGRFQSNVANDSYSSLFHTASNSNWDGVKFYVHEGGAVLDSSYGKHIWWALPLISGAEQDGGLTCILGKSKDVVLCGKAKCSYNGPTRTVFAGSAGDNNGSLQCRVENALPGTTTIQLGPRTQVGFASEWSASTQVSQTVARVEGVGSVVYCEKLVVTNGIAAVFDDAYGTLTFGRVCSISGDYDIVGDASGCGCVKFNQNQDISHLKLKIAAGATLDASKKGTYYKIVDAPNGFTGFFDKSELPDNWDVKYTSTAAYLYSVKGTILILR